MTKTPPRPVFLDLRRIRLPLPGIISIGHRLAGVILFLALPASVYLLDHSLTDAAGFARTTALLQGWPGRLTGLCVLWALVYHLLAGGRLLLLDMGMGTARDKARRSAWIVAGLGLCGLLLGAIWL